jgi:hypothetical protein
MEQKSNWNTFFIETNLKLEQILQILKFKHLNIFWIWTFIKNYFF